MSTPQITVFVSSPGDVGAERVLAEKVLERLKSRFRRRAEIRAILWEHEPLRATQGFQEQITSPAEADIVVCILWSRLGTRLPKTISHADGTPYASGTEYEFEVAARSYMEKGVPDLLVYRKSVKPIAEIDERDALSERVRQYEALQGFINRWFEGPDGSFRAAFHKFERAEEFETRLESHLTALIQRRLPSSSTVSAYHTSAIHAGDPYRGLKSFEVEHGTIFFGRTAAVESVRVALVRQAAAGRPFLLVLGPSGCGKSSLVRAGVIPLITKPGVVEHVGLWRWCIVQPGDSPLDLLAGLAAAIVSDAPSSPALPELRDFGYTPAELTALLRKAPELATTPIRNALRQAGTVVAAAEHLPALPEARLAVVVDQLEQVFADGGPTRAQQLEFFAALSALAHSGSVWVLATMRSDFYYRCSDVPALMDLKQGAGQYDLSFPTAAEIAQMIRLPAQATGVAFEQETQSGATLDQTLLNEGVANPSALPLLEFLLDELFRERSNDGVMTFESYRRLNGLSGAIATHAERLLSGLAKPALGSLIPLFRDLAQVTADGKIVSRRVPRIDLETSPERRSVLKTLIDGRLCTTDSSAMGEVTVGVAHESLFTHWPRVKAALEADLEFIRGRARIMDAAMQWAATGKPATLLLRYKRDLASAKAWLESRWSDLPHVAIEFISASIRGQRRRRLAVMAFGAALLLLVSTVAWLGVQRHLVVRKTEVANQRRSAAEKLASAERYAGLIAAAGMQAADRRPGWTYRITSLLESARELRPTNADLAPSRTLLANCYSTFDLEELPIEPVVKSNAFCIAFNRKGTRLAIGPTHAAFGAITGLDVVVVDVAERKQVGKFNVSAGGIITRASGVRALAFAHDDEWLLVGTVDGHLCICDATFHGTPVIATLRPHTERVTSIVVSPTGRLFCTSSTDGTILMWNRAQPGSPVQTVRLGTPVSCASFNRTGELLACGSALWFKVFRVGVDGELHQVVEVAGDHRFVRFLPGDVLCGTEGTGLALWVIRDTSAILSHRFVESGGRMAHTDEVTWIDCSPDGMHIASGSADRTIKVWDRELERPVMTIPAPGTGNVFPAFDSAGRYLATTSSRGPLLFPLFGNRSRAGIWSSWNGG